MSNNNKKYLTRVGGHVFDGLEFFPCELVKTGKWKTVHERGMVGRCKNLIIVGVHIFSPD